MSSRPPLQQAKTNPEQQNAQHSAQLITHGEFADQRPQSTAQRQLQDHANNSRQTLQLRALQRMLQGSEKAMQLRATADLINSSRSSTMMGEKSDDKGSTTPLQQITQRMAQPSSDIQRAKEPTPHFASPVIQRLMNPAPVVGTAMSYHVAAADLGNGTGTTPLVRMWAQANAPGPNPINFRYATSNAAGTAVGAWNGPFAAPNPAPAGGANWHAGHILARQNGGFGNVPAGNWIMPQNPQVNMGHAGTYGLWRAHEVAFHNLVGANGYGVWHVW